MKVYTLFFALTAFGLAGCDVPQPTEAFVAPTVGESPAPVADAPTIGSAPVSVPRAVALFDTICGASLPSFTSAARRMAENNINQRTVTDEITVYSPTENISFQVQDGPGQGRTCSMVFGTTETVLAARAGFAVMGQFVETPLGPGTLYRRTQAVVLIGRNAVQGDTTYLNLRLLSER